MAEKQCGKCGEMVDEAKAFCPGCGHSFVDEKQRTTVSDFDQSKRTVQLGETMFNQMLSEMGLSISKHPEREEKNTEVVTPLAPSISATAPKREAQPLPPKSDKRSSRIIKIALIVFAAVAFAILVMLATVAALFFYYR
jgi:hypothetical protein